MTEHPVVEVSMPVEVATALLDVVQKAQAWREAREANAFQPTHPTVSFAAEGLALSLAAFDRTERDHKSDLSSALASAHLGMAHTQDNDEAEGNDGEEESSSAEEETDRDREGEAEAQRSIESSARSDAVGRADGDDSGGGAPRGKAG